MPLKIDELIKKAKDKGITSSYMTNCSPPIIKPWQQESILFEQPKECSKNHEKLAATNWQQTSNKPATNWQQSSNKQKTKWQQNLESDNKPVTQATTQEATNWQQTGNKLETKLPAKMTLSSLVGLQRAIVILIYKECKLARSNTTEEITLEHISISLQSRNKSVKTTIQRLEKKGFIKRVFFKTGRGGWSKYSLPDLLFKELLQYETDNKLETNWKQSDNKVVTQGTTQPTTSFVVSSSYINNTTTNIPEGFQQIDYSPLSNIGFDESHIIQIHREHKKNPELALSIDIIQNSINAFAFDLRYNDIANSFKSSPAVVLTSLLKKGQPYSSKTPEKVLTPREEAMKEYILAQELKNARRLEMEGKTKELALQEWLDSLPEEELLKFNPDGDLHQQGVPETLHQMFRRKKALANAKDYFVTVLWPDRLKQIVST